MYTEEKYILKLYTLNLKEFFSTYKIKILIRKAIRFKNFNAYRLEGST